MPVKKVSDNSKSVISYIATGGTIAMERSEGNSGPVPSIDGQDLLSRVPGLELDIPVEVDNFSNIPSAHLTPRDWIALHRYITAVLAREKVRGIIISHGTDTLEETAYFLDLTLDSPKPVVLFGAQRSACEPDTDGPANLADALQVAASEEARQRGVMVVMNHQIAAARDVSKTHTTDLDSFQCDEAGFLGSVSNNQVRFNRLPAERQHIPLLDSQLCRVDIVPVYPGADNLMVGAAIEAGAKGIVIQALGAGNVNPSLLEAIIVAIEAGIAVVITSRVPRGSVKPVYGFPGGGQTLVQAGAIFAYNLSPQKARILLMLGLQKHLQQPELEKLFH